MGRMGNPSTSTIELLTTEGPMPAVLAEPAEDPRGGVVVVQEAFGLTGHIQRVAESLAAAGFLAVAPAMFHRSGSPVLEYGDLSQLGPVIGALSGEGIAGDVDAALALLAERGLPAERSAVIGFCMGGTIAMATAVRRPLGAAVTFYGAGITTGRFGLPALADAAPQLQTPWLGLYGDLDAHIPVEEVEQLRAAAATAPVPTEVVRYADADHGFHCDERPSFHAASSSDAWARTLRFLGDHLS
jgi:carboxymethylenebutenolidase